MNNLFVKGGFYTIDPLFLELTKNWPVQQSLSSMFGMKRILIAGIKSLGLMSDSASLVNTCWFWATLFIISLIHLGVCLLTKKADVKLEDYSVLTSLRYKLNCS